MTDLTAVARNIVNQILDESGADVVTRQRINDTCDAFALRLIEGALAASEAARQSLSERAARDVLDAEARAVKAEQDMASLRADYDEMRPIWMERIRKAEQQRDDARRDCYHAETRARQQFADFAAAEAQVAALKEVLDAPYGSVQFGLLHNGCRFIEAAYLHKALARVDAPKPDDEKGAGWVDRHGDVWRLGDDGLMHTPETAPFPREHVEKKWGPLRPVETGADQ